MLSISSLQFEKYSAHTHKNEMKNEDVCVCNRLNHLSLSGGEKLGEGQTVDCDSLLALTLSLL